jgi:hypothetical protein
LALVGSNFLGDSWVKSGLPEGHADDPRRDGIPLGWPNPGIFSSVHDAADMEVGKEPLMQPGVTEEAEGL